MTNIADRTAEPTSVGIVDDLLRLLRCLLDGSALTREGGGLVSSAGARYAVAAAGIPLLPKISSRRKPLSSSFTTTPLPRSILPIFSASIPRPTRIISIACWQPAGLLGFCLFMNSHVLVVNRLFRFIPGITGLARVFARLDEALLRLPPLCSAGLQVIDVASRR